jgi:hypothetical protein
VWACDALLAGITGLNPARDMDLSLVSVVYWQVKVSVGADPSPRAVLPSVVYLNVIVKPPKAGRPGPIGTIAP